MLTTQKEEGKGVSHPERNKQKMGGGGGVLSISNKRKKTVLSGTHRHPSCPSYYATASMYTVGLKMEGVGAYLGAWPRAAVAHVNRVCRSGRCVSESFKMRYLFFLKLTWNPMSAQFKIYTMEYGNQSSRRETDHTTHWLPKSLKHIYTVWIQNTQYVSVPR